MTIDPKTSAVINLLLAVLGAVSASTAEWTTIFGSGTAQQIVGIAGAAATVVGVFNAGLHGVSSSSSGPLVK